MESAPESTEESGRNCIGHDGGATAADEESSGNVVGVGGPSIHHQQQHPHLNLEHIQANIPGLFQLPTAAESFPLSSVVGSMAALAQASAGMSSNSYYSYCAVLSEKLELEKMLTQSQAKFVWLQDELSKTAHIANVMQQRNEQAEKIIFDQQKQIGMLQAQLEEYGRLGEDATGNNVRQQKAVKMNSDPIKALEMRLNQKFLALQEYICQRDAARMEQTEARHQQLLGMLIKLSQDRALNTAQDSVNPPLKREVKRRNRCVAPAVPDIFSTGHVLPLFSEEETKRTSTEENVMSMPLPPPPPIVIKAEPNTTADETDTNQENNMNIGFDVVGDFAESYFSKAALQIDKAKDVNQDKFDRGLQEESTKKMTRKRSRASKRVGHEIDELLVCKGVFACTCGDHLSSKYSLRRHIELKKGEKKEFVRSRYFCEPCGQNFSSKKKLFVHNAAVHNSNCT